MKPGKSNRKAFTLVEILIVICVISILFVVLISRVDFATDKARIAGAQNDIRTLQMSAHTVAIHDGMIVNDLDLLAQKLNENLDSAMSISIDNNKLVTQSTDPWGNKYQLSYANPTNTKGQLYIQSAGPDLIFNTKDDIVSAVVCKVEQQGTNVIIKNDVSINEISPDNNNNEQHVCTYNQMVQTIHYLHSEGNCCTPSIYYYSCLCGLAGNTTFEGVKNTNNHIADRNYTYTPSNNDMHITATKCAGCGVVFTNSTEAHEFVNSICQKCYYHIHVHEYNNQRIDNAYIASLATCTKPAQYYLTCSCGAIGSNVFEYGSVNSSNHTGIVGYGGTEESHTEYNCCYMITSIAHEYTENVIVEATCTKPGTTQYNCICGYTYTLNNINPKDHVDINNNNKCDDCDTTINDNLLTITIVGETPNDTYSFYYIAGMTWGELVNSQYNVDNRLYIHNQQVLINTNWMFPIMKEHWHYIPADMIISNESNYTVEYETNSVLYYQTCNHALNEATYTWATSCKSVTASIDCKNCLYSFYETQETQKVIIQEATCLLQETYKHRVQWINGCFKDIECNTIHEGLLGNHVYDLPSLIWNNDCSLLTTSTTCLQCNNIVSQSYTSEKNVISDSTCISYEKYNHVATYTITENGQTVSKTVDCQKTHRGSEFAEHKFVNKICSVCGFKLGLDQYTWDEIKEIADLNLSASDLFEDYGIALGDYKTQNNKKYYLVDLDGNQYDGFVFAYVATGEEYMGEKDGEGHYLDSTLIDIIEESYNDLPSDLQNVIKEVNITCRDVSNNTTRTHRCYVFIPSIREVGGCQNTTESTILAEGELFEFFNSDSNRKLISSKDWWTRTPSKASSFYIVYGDGGLKYTYNTYMPWTVGVATFVVGSGCMHEPNIPLDSAVSCTESIYCTKCNETLKPPSKHQCVQFTCTICNQYIPGLYSDNYEVVATWDELVSKYYMNIEKSYNNSSLPSNHISNIIKNAELSEGTILVLSPTVEKIGFRAFYTCKQLKQIVFSDNVVTIEQNAFYQATDLENIIFNTTSKLELIRGYAFCGCSNLQSLVLPDSLTTIEGYAFKNSGLQTVVIGDGIKVLGDSVFEICKSLTSVTFGSNSHIEECGQLVFGDCSALTTVKFNNINQIGWRVFWYCTNLTNLSVGNYIEDIKTQAFDGCNNIALVEYNGGYYFGNDENPYVVMYDMVDSKATYLELHPDTKVIAPGGCASYSLSNVVLPEGLLGMSYMAFWNDNALQSIYIPSTVKNIAADAFGACHGMQNYNVSQDNPYYKSINGHLYSKDGKTFVQYAIGNKQTSFVIPEGVETLAHHSFYGADFETVHLADTVKTMATEAFYHCDMLTTVTIGENSQLEILGMRAFQWADLLVNITLPNTLKEIKYNAFWGTNVTTIMYNGTMAEWQTIKLDSEWYETYSSTVILSVICTDGTLTYPYS